MTNDNKNQDSMVMLKELSNKLSKSFTEFSQRWNNMQNKQMGSSDPGFNILSAIKESLQQMQGLVNGAQNNSEPRVKKDDLKSVLQPVIQALMLSAGNDAAKKDMNEQQGKKPMTPIQAFFLEMTRANFKDEKALDILADLKSRLSLEDNSSALDATADYNIDILEDISGLLKAKEDQIVQQNQDKASGSDFNPAPPSG